MFCSLKSYVMSRLNDWCTFRVNSTARTLVPYSMHHNECWVLHNCRSGIKHRCTYLFSIAHKSETISPLLIHCRNIRWQSWADCATGFCREISDIEHHILNSFALPEEGGTAEQMLVSRNKFTSFGWIGYMNIYIAPARCQTDYFYGGGTLHARRPLYERCGSITVEPAYLERK